MAQADPWTRWLDAVFGVFYRARPYLNALYLLAALPLGVAYFVFLITGWALGLGLMIVWVGFLILAAVVLLSFGISWFERLLAIHLLGARVGPIAASPAGLGGIASRAEGQNETGSKETEGFLNQAKAFLTNKVTWTGMMFLFLKFPLGVVSFVMTVVGFAVSGTLLAAPIYFRWDPPTIGWFGTWWVVDTLPEALLCSLVGLVFLIASLHLVNALAWVWRFLAEALLGHGPEPVPAEA